MAVTTTLASVVAESNFDALPGNAIEAAKRGLLDTIGVAIEGCSRICIAGDSECPQRPGWYRDSERDRHTGTHQRTAGRVRERGDSACVGAERVLTRRAACRVTRLW